MLPTADFSLQVLLYGIFVLGSFGFLWFYYDRRDRAFYDGQRRKVTFHCIRCDQLYTQSPGIEVAPCPRCAHMNARLKF